MAKSNGKLSREEFTRIAVLHGQSENKDGKKGIFANRGYFRAFVTYFGESPYKYNSKTKQYTGWLVEAVQAGKFEGHPVGSGTWIIYLKGEAPARKASVAVDKECNAILKLAAKAAKA